MQEMHEAAGVQYTRPEGAPHLLMFRCEPLRATVSTRTCASNWEGCQDDPEHPRFYNCSRCPIGAAHAGQTVTTASPIKGAPICGRCQRFTDRLVRGHLCVSCYNRQCEVLTGKNAKGSAPVRHPPLGPRSMRVMVGDQPQRVGLALAVSDDELMVKALREAPARVRFMWDADRPARFAQQRLW